MAAKPSEEYARAYAIVAGVDWATVRDWYQEGTSIVLVTVKESPTLNKGWAA